MRKEIGGVLFQLLVPGGAGESNCMYLIASVARGSRCAVYLEEVNAHDEQGDDARERMRALTGREPLAIGGSGLPIYLEQRPMRQLAWSRPSDATTKQKRDLHSRRSPSFTKEE